MSCLRPSLWSPLPSLFCPVWTLTPLCNAVVQTLRFIKKKNYLLHFIPAKLISPKPFDVWHTCLAILLLLKQKSHILAEGQCQRYSWVHLGGQAARHQLKGGRAARRFPHPPLLLPFLKAFQHITSCEGRGRRRSNAGACSIRLLLAPWCLPCWGLRLPGWQFRGCRTAEKRLSCCKDGWCSPRCPTGLAALGQTLCLSRPGAQQPHSQEERSGACPTGWTDVGSKEILAMAGVAHCGISMCLAAFQYCRLE